MMNIILASASVRRIELMRLITQDFIVRTSDVDESAITAPSPMQLSVSLARAKCEAVAAQNAEDIVIGCDTVVDVDGKVFGKPHSKREAETTLNILSGRTHLVHTGVSIFCKGKYNVFSDTTKVFFTDIAAQDIKEYINTDEPYDKAGGYGIQGWAAKYVYRIEGCYYNIMGLPVSKLSSELIRVF
ncbi:MAG: Maf family protein [Oscillospiraceae bacterium]